METSSREGEAGGQRGRITPSSRGCDPQTPGKAQQTREAGLRGAPFSRVLRKFGGGARRSLL